MNNTDVMKQALDAMVVLSYSNSAIDEVCINLRKAIEEAEKVEPVAWMNKDGWIGLYKQGDATIPLYTAPPQREWVGLTDDEIDECFKQMGRGLDKYATFARAIEAKLRGKNK